MQKAPILLALFISFFTYSQSSFLANDILPELKENANSVVVFEKIQVNISSIKKMTKNHKRIITVLNKNGNEDVLNSVAYDKYSKVKKIEAIVYNASGKEIEKFSKSDFLDISSVDGGTLYSDDREYYLRYSPKEYPYTFEFNYEIESSLTAHLSSWYPISCYNCSVKESIIEVNYKPEIQIRHKLVDDFSIIDFKESPGNLTFNISNSKAIEREDYSPAFSEFLPHVLMSMNDFQLANVKGTGGNWDIFGEWMNENLIKGNSDIPISTINKIKDLTKNETDHINKARIIYQYVQDHTRYISVQIGVGGWKPMPASFVDENGYGDCKALTNYTKSLMDVVGISSYYTILYAGDNKRDILKDFSSLQGDHVILAIENDDDYIWLECTNQQVPFGYIAGFTDDRDVLLITPEGGKIAHTKKYTPEENILVTKAICELDNTGNLTADVTLESKGYQYDSRYDLYFLDEDDKIDSYKEYWDYIDNVYIESIDLLNNKTDILFTEHVKFTANSYGSFLNNDMIVPINMLNRISNVPKRYKNRERKLKINRGFIDNDEFELTLPEGYSFSSIPEPIVIETVFGKYSSSIELTSDNKIKYLRRLEHFEGVFPKENYKEYRLFRKKVSKYDNQKILLIKK